MILETALLTGVLTAATNAYFAYQNGEISKEQYRQAVDAANALEKQLKSLRPDETWQNLDPQLLQKTAEFVPEIASFVEENAPQLIKEAGTEEQQRIQRQALRQYAAQAESGRDVISEAQREQALFEAGARSKQRQQLLQQRLKQQGLLGTGAALSAQLGIEQEEEQTARQSALQGVQEAEMRRRQALGQAASMAGQMREQSLQVESANVGTMNQYNQRLANARNLYNQYASGARNEAQLENQRREMQRQAANLQMANEYARYNREQAMAAKERARAYDVDVATKMHGIRSGAEQQKYEGQRATNAGYGSAITSGLGAGMSMYGGLSSAQAASAALGASASKQAYYDALLKNMGQGAAYGIGQGLGSSTTQRYQPRYNLGINTRIPPYRKLEDDIENPEIDIYSPYGR